MLVVKTYGPHENTMHIFNAKRVARGGHREHVPPPAKFEYMYLYIYLSIYTIQLDQFLPPPPPPPNKILAMHLNAFDSYNQTI